jgi:hypothetical protein
VLGSLFTYFGPSRSLRDRSHEPISSTRTVAVEPIVNLPLLIGCLLCLEPISLTAEPVQGLRSLSPPAEMGARGLSRRAAPDPLKLDVEIFP